MGHHVPLLRCIHCRSESFYGDAGLAPDLPLARIQSRLDELYASGIRRIHFLGGEPFSRRDLSSIVAHASNLGILCSVNTNGTLITRAIADAMVDAGVYLITFSIDGFDAATNDHIRGSGTFERALRGIGHFHAARRSRGSSMRMICSHVLMRSNLSSVARMVDLCTSIGLHNLIVTNLRRMGGAIASYSDLAVTDEEKLWAAEQLVERMKAGPHCHVQVETVGLLGKIYLNARYGAALPIFRAGCTALTSKAYVQPDGALFPCQDVAKQVSTPAEHARVVAGGVEQWHSDAYSALPRALNHLSSYERYIPCNKCPALGTLCMPCPLHGLRGQPVRQKSCLHVLRRAQEAGVDLAGAVTRASQAAWRDRLVQDPRFRRDFFSAANLAHHDPDMLSFQGDVLGGLQSMLRTATETTKEAQWPSSTKC